MNSDEQAELDAMQFGSTVLPVNIRGRHASNESMIVVRNSDGKGEYVRNLNTRIDPSTTELTFLSACEGTVCLRIDDKLRSDFWTEFNLDVATLEWLLAKAKETDAKNGVRSD